MSGGFFRGTSADQDTRFSNKQAKLLKSQKFAPELENLVDMTKVKMDVLKPWIAKRVTELIGFEDEVLINFIYSLLEGKAVNGKQVQIQLTGFMERNTGKFMKELWALLLSAQQNVTGIPQLFLDAKEEETRKKEAETDHKSNEIRKKEKGNQELEEEKSKMDGDGAKSRDMNFALRHDAGGSMAQRADDKDRYRRNGQRRSSRGSQSPGSSQHSPSTRQKHLSPVKSNSRSYSDERQRSRSVSGTPPSRGRSASSERQDRSAPRRSLTPRRRHITRNSPAPWRRSSHMRRRSRSHSRRRSPSPARFRVHSPRRQRSRSPLHRRSRSPVRRRSRTPIRRSPVRYRSRTPLRRRSSSPMQGRSPSPIRGKSPSFRRRRSPSPVHRRSPSPVRRGPRSLLRRRSPSPRHRSPSPPRRRHQRSMSRSLSPERLRPSMLGRKRSFTPDGSSPLRESSSPSHIRPNSLSPVGKGSPRSMRSPRKSPGERTRHEKYSSTHHASPIERSERSENRKGRSTERRPIVSLRSPQRDMLDRSEAHGKSRGLSPSMENSPVGSDVSRERSDSEEQRSMSPRGSPRHKRGRIVQPKSPSPLRKAAVPKAHHESSSVDVENNFSSREVGLPRHRSSGKTSPVPKDSKDALDRVENHGLADRTKTRKTLSNSDRLHDTANLKEYHGRSDLSTTSKTSLSVKNKDSYDDGARAKYKKLDRVDDSKGDNQISDSEGPRKLARKSEKNGLMDSPSKEADELRGKVRESRKQKRSERREEESNDYSSSDSYEERKEAKRRRREEKKLKKEERRRRRENKQRKKDEKRAEKLKLKSNDPDLAHNHSEDESVRRRESQASNIKETASEQKKLEIELREKALESLRARKGFGN